MGVRLLLLLVWSSVKRNVRVAHQPNNTLRRILMSTKDRPEVPKMTRIVYKLNCLDCPQSYVGQTGRKLETRRAEHRADVRTANPDSQVAQHTMEYDHRFDFEAMHVIGRGKNVAERLVKEAWLSDNGGLNRCIELHPAYKALR